MWYYVLFLGIFLVISWLVRGMIVRSVSKRVEDKD